MMNKMIGSILKRLKPLFTRIYRKFAIPNPPNLLGDRDIEHSWIAANIPDGSGKAIDFGSGPTWMGLLAARKGYSVLSIDLTDVEWFYQHNNLNFSKINIFDVPYESNSLQLVINCSTIEHVGLKGRYNTKEEQGDGDIDAMKFLGDLLSPGGLMLMTVPVGQDTVYHPFHRIYGSSRLPRLIEGWEIIKEEYWSKDTNNIWIKGAKNEILDSPTKRHYYNLGLFVLKPIK